jgi:hypothetical protein
MPLTKLVTSNITADAVQQQNFTTNTIAGTKIPNRTLLNVNFADNTINPSSFRNLTITNVNTKDFAFNSSGALTLIENFNTVNQRLITYSPGVPYYGSTTFDWLAGCYCDFTPTSSTSYIRFLCKYGTGYYNDHCISHLKFFANGVEICRWSSSLRYDERTCHFERIIPSWGTSAGRIGLQMRIYGTSNQHQFNATNWWAGGGYNLDGAGVGNRSHQNECVVEELPNKSRTTVTSGITFPGGIIATGGDVIYDQGDYRVHVFENTGTFTVTQLGNDPTWGNKVWYLTVAGGGGGGSDMGGGGGAGGVVENQIHTVTTTSYGVTVGAGGAGSTGVYGANPVPGYTGSNSVFGSTETALGGGGGGSGHTSAPYSSATTRATAGGSGGGASATVSSVGQLYGAANIPGQGTFGGRNTINGSYEYFGGGGGGAGSNSTGLTLLNPTSYPIDVDAYVDATNRRAGHGGQGIHSMILGIPKYFAGGGGSAIYTGAAAGQGGLGGGGGGSRWDLTATQGGGGGQAGFIDTAFGSATYNWRWLWDGSGETGYGGNGALIRGGNALVNSGGGGGGAGHQSNQGGAGGKGVVIVRYRYTNTSADGLLGTIGNPAANASQILAARPGVASGNYYILIDGESVPIYCDMTNQGGGWMLAGAGREGIYATAWWNNGGAGNYYENLTQANLAVTTPRYLPAAAVRGICGGNTWNEVEMIVNRTVLGDSFSFKTNASMFAWSSFNPGLVNTGSAAQSTAQHNLTFARYASPWLAGSAAYTYTNAYWVDTINAGAANDINRSFTWPWGSHGGYSGWSAGASITTGFQYTTEGHAIQQVNIFVR